MLNSKHSMSELNCNDQMQLIDHFEELRKRVIYSLTFALFSFVICYYFSENIFQILLKPLSKIVNWESKKIIYTNLTEAFFSYIKLSMFVSFAFTIPYCLMQLYIFLAPGLYKKEKIAILPYLISVPILFTIGCMFVYNYVFPMAWKFFLSFEMKNINNISIALEPKISEYISLSLHLMVAFGIAFQLPIFLVFLMHMNFISVEKLIELRRFAIIIIFIIAAIITPPDAISQISLAIPMIILYEVAILIGKFIKKQRSKNA